MKNLLVIFVFTFTLFGLIDAQSTTGRGTTQQPSPGTTGGGSTQRSSPRTTYPPGPITCYVCSQCPLPFTSNSFSVTTATTVSRWCAKKSRSSDTNAPASRGVDTGECAYYGYYGCTWRTINGVSTYLCCCRTSYCNVANSNSKMNFSILFFSLLIFFISKKLNN